MWTSPSDLQCAAIALVNGLVLSGLVSTVQVILAETLLLDDRNLLCWCHTLELRAGIQWMPLNFTKVAMVLGISLCWLHSCRGEAFLHWLVQSLLVFYS